MQPGISSHVFLPQRLTPSLLDTLAHTGAQTIEVFAVRQHFDYADRDTVRELASWFRSNNVAASLHMPLFLDDGDFAWSRRASPTVNLLAEQKPARIAAMDEVKRALEAAEMIPFRSCVVHLGLKNEPWSSRALDDSMTAIEHLKAFASPLGVKLLLENLTNAIATPEHLVEIVRVGHFASVGFCLDVGHAHLSDEGIAAAFEVLGPRIAELHLHDNHGPDGGRGDEHLWPALDGERPAWAEAGSIDWKALYALAAALPGPVAGVLEIASAQAPSPEDAARLAGAVFAHWRRSAETEG